MNIFGFNFDSILSSALIVISLAAVILLVYMLLRILSEQDKIYKEIRSGTSDLLEAGKKLHSMYGLAERLATRREQENFTKPQPESKVQSELSEAQIAQSIEKIERIAVEMRALIDTMMDTPTAELPRWRDSNEASIQKLLADQQLLTPEINKLQNSLTRIANDLKRPDNANNNTTIDSGKIRDLEQQLDSYQKMMMKTRERIKNAENSANILQSEMDVLIGKNTRLAAEITSHISDKSQLQEELTKAENERSSLIQNIDTLTNEILRTKIEKNFIEDRFIELT